MVFIEVPDEKVRALLENVIRNSIEGVEFRVFNKEILGFIKITRFNETTQFVI